MPWWRRRLGLVVGTGRGRHEQVIGAGGLATFGDHFHVEHFAGAVLGARDQHQERLVGERGVDLCPRGVGVRDERAVLGDLTADGGIDVGGREGEFGTVHIGGEHDAVIADTDFHDFGHAVGGACVEVFLADARGGVGDVDGVFAHAFTHLGTAGTRAAAFDHGGREVEVFAEGFGDDGSIGQNGRGTGDLDLVTGRGGHGHCGQRERRHGEFGEGHGCLP